MFTHLALWRNYLPPSEAVAQSLRIQEGSFLKEKWKTDNPWIAKKGFYVMAKEKLVFVRHGNPGLFLFNVPLDLDLFAGDNVICHTRFGQAHGICVCDSFYTEFGREIRQAAGVGAEATLKSVIGFSGGQPPRANEPAVVPDAVDMPFDEVLW